MVPSVKIHSLVAAPQHNGMLGKLVTYDSTTGKYQIELQDCILSLKPANVTVQILEPVGARAQHSPPKERKQANSGVARGTSRNAARGSRSVSVDSLLPSPSVEDLTLKRNWVVVPSSRRNRPYYFNRVTGESTWYRPPEANQFLPEARDASKSRSRFRSRKSFMPLSGGSSLVDFCLGGDRAARDPPDCMSDLASEFTLAGDATAANAFEGERLGRGSRREQGQSGGYDEEALGGFEDLERTGLGKDEVGFDPPPPPPGGQQWQGGVENEEWQSVENGAHWISEIPEPQGPSTPPGRDSLVTAFLSPTRRMGASLDALLTNTSHHMAPLISETQSLCSNEEEDRRVSMLVSPSLNAPEETQHFNSNRIDRYKVYLTQKNLDKSPIKPGRDTSTSLAKQRPTRVYYGAVRSGAGNLSPQRPVHSPSSSRAAREVSNSPERQSSQGDWAHDFYDPEWEA